ncbi:MAG: serine/threonine protein kinase [Candidatus Riflebacteria bacterium]|nr:serine/threonine protein kinase [Candidatus Riflebacteria bacterium]
MHSRGFVHRDIKPGNIMVTRDGVAKLVDFGLVKSRFATNITVTGVVIGTPAFMSPEMLRGHEVDHRSDIFQLGTVLYKMLSGRHAFDGSDSFEMATSCVSKPPPSLSALNPKVTPIIEWVVFLCLEKAPDDRYQSAADLANDLRRVEKGLKPMGNGRKPALNSSAAIPAPTSATVTAALAPARDPGSLLTMKVASGLLCLAAAMAILFWTFYPAGGYESRNLKVVPGLRKARVVWDSDRAYSTRAIFRPASAAGAPGARAAEAGGTEVANAEETAATHHTLELRDLQPDSPYQLELVYPNGSLSLPETFRTQDPALASTGFSMTETGAMVFTFTTFVPVTATVRPGHGALVSAKPSGLSTSHEAVLADADPLSDGTVLVQCTNALQEQWTPNPVPMPNARTMARDLVRTLGGIMGHVDVTLAALEKAERQRTLTPDLVKDVLPKAVVESMTRFAPVGPAFFGSQKVLLDEKLALYRLLMRLDALDHCAFRLKLPFSSGAVRMLGPDFGPIASARLPDKESLKVDVATQVMGASMSSALADLASAFAKTAKKVKIPFQISNVAVVKQVEFITNTMWEEEFAFEGEVAVQINSEVELVLRAPLDPSKASRHLRFVHGFDPRALTEGTNEFTLTLRPLPGFKAITKILVRDVELRLVR